MDSEPTELAQPLFESLSDFTKEYNVNFHPESANVTSELLNIINTGIIQEKDMTDYRHLECLAFYYENVKGDYVKAVEYFELALSNGSPYAANSLAELYTRKIKDYEMAKKYYLTAISNGDKLSMINYAFMCAMHIPEDYDMAIQTLVDIMDNKAESQEYRIKAIFALFAIYYKQNEGLNTIKYLRMGADMGYVDSMCTIYKLVNEYDPVIYDDEIFPNCVEEADKYITKALAMQSQWAFELYIKYKIERANSWINKHKKCIIPSDVMDSLVEYGRANPELITQLDTPATQQAWTYIATKLGIPCNTNVAIRITKHSKLAICDICMSDGEKQCIPVNWCLHYACVDCYWLLDNKPCPFCRCE
jgi:TPR repeat protein